MINDHTTFHGSDQGSTINFLNTPRVAEWFANNDDAAAEEAANEYGTFKDADDVRQFPASFGFEHASNFMPLLVSEYLVKGVLDVGSSSVFYGPSNCGKTFLALDMAYHIAAGVHWHGRRVRQATVLYLATEGGRGIINRVAALRDEYGHDVPFYVLRSGINLLEANGGDVAMIVDAATAAKKATGNDTLLIVVDTLARAIAGGDENSSVDMGKLIANIDTIREQTGAHVMIIHHTGKDTARGARGHSNLRGAIDTEIEVTAPAEGSDIRKMISRKQRDYAIGEEFDFTLEVVNLGYDQDGDAVTTCIAKRVDNSNPFGDAPPIDIQRCIEKIGAGMENGDLYTAANTGVGSRWAGNVFISELGVSKDQAAILVKKAIDSGKLIEVEYRSPVTRKDRKGLKAAM